MTRDILGEGPTEVRLIKNLHKHVAPGQYGIFHAGSKNTLWSRAKDLLKTGIDRGEHYSILLLRDRDEGEKNEDILEEFERSFQQFLVEQEIDASISFHQPIPQDYTNLFSCKLHIPDKVQVVQVLLHIPKPPTLNVEVESYPFNNATTDHYILATALIDGVVTRFAKDAGIPSQVFFKKVTQEIPDLLRANGITNIGVKDLLLGYMTASRFLTIKGSESKETFLDIVADRAWKYAPDTYQHIFASHIAAINLIVQQEYTA